MSTLLRAHALTHAMGREPLFENLDVSVTTNDRIGLVGHNGSGKSTLLGVLAGAREPDSGRVERRNGLRLALVEQFLPARLAGSTLLAAATAAAPEEPWRAEATLGQLGFSDDEFDVPVSGLSGGQQNRLMFARALVADPELLLLDEPTNHLDLATMVVFEAALAAFPGACVVVSHDREFLDTVTHSTLFLRDRRVYRFSTPYSAAISELEDMDAAAARVRAAEDRKIDELKVSAKRLATWGKVYDNEKMSRRAKSMEKRIDRMEADRTEVSRGSPLDLDVRLGEARSKQTLLMEHLSVTVAGRDLFEVDECLIRPGERVALLGHNGVGKTTLIRHIVGAAHGETEDPRCRLGPQIRLGYYDQELDEVSGRETMLAFVRNRVTGRVMVDEQTLRGRLIHAGFAYPDHGKRVEEMSGGERARLLFLVLSLNEPNFLILDEPTNHIDIAGKEQLESQLIASAAAVLVTSHDRRFLETVAERYLWIQDGRLLEVNSPTSFFEQASGATDVAGAAPDRARDSDDGPVDGESAEDVLALIVQLEDKLTADRQRKPRFQKPRLQAQWEAEIKALYERLGD